MRGLFLSFTIVVGLAACDRPPSSEGLATWTPADHDGEKRAGGNPKQGAKGDAGGTPSLVEITWRNQCATCHGVSGRGDGPQGPMFKPPDLSQSKASDDEVASIIKNGKGRMPKFDLDDAVVQGLTARVRSFRGQ